MPDGPQPLDTRTVEILTAGLRLIALRALSDASDADDVVQETLSRGMTAIDLNRLQAPDNIGPYFRGILRHVIADLMRDRGKTLSLDAMTAPPAANSHVDALATLISREDAALVVKALQALPPRSRECLRLSFYEGLTPTQIAERLHEPAPRVRKRRSRALKSLRAVFFRQRADGHDPVSSATYVGEPQPSTEPVEDQTPNARRNVDER